MEQGAALSNAEKATELFGPIGVDVEGRYAGGGTGDSRQGVACSASSVRASRKKQ